MTQNINKRLDYLETRTDTKSAALWQVLQPEGGAIVHYAGGHTVTVIEPLPGLKTYSGFNPADWDKVQVGDK